MQHGDYQEYFSLDNSISNVRTHVPGDDMRAQLGGERAAVTEFELSI